jgi:hypothetical protein
MKLIVIAVILGVAALVAVQVYLTVTGQDCPNGVVVTSLDQCRTQRGFDQTFCVRVFDNADRVAREVGAVYRSQDECTRRNNPVCIMTENPIGWVARPAGYCVARGADGSITRMTPVYEGFAQRVGR